MDDPAPPFLIHKLYECLWDDKYTCLVNDKCLFHCFCRYHEIPVPELYGVLRKGELIAEERNFDALMSKNNFEKVVLKPIRGVQGKGIHFITREAATFLSGSTPASNKHPLPRDLKKQDFIIQERIRQHPELNRINPSSVNTVRIVTILARSGQVEFLSAILRTSSSHSAIDNFNSGGIVIGVDLPTGKLKRQGFFKPQYGTTVTSHPLTKVEFHNFQIPCWKEILEIATKAQETFHYLKSIGWDLAVCPDGPVVIEGNVEWGTAGLQAANAGLLNARNRSLFAQYGLFFHE